MLKRGGIPQRVAEFAFDGKTYSYGKIGGNYVSYLGCVNSPLRPEAARTRDYAT